MALCKADNMQLWILLQENTLLALTFFGVIGLCIGSFLNVVIYRTPLIMMHQWRAGSAELLKSQADIPSHFTQPIADIVNQDTSPTLSAPASHCPKCLHKITWYENIPLLSWLILQGKCSSCKTKISIRYPIIELITALLTVLVIYKFGVNLPSIAALILVWTLIALAVIDFDTQLLPDKFTFPLMGLGLAINSQGWFVSPTQSIWGLLIGYLSLWVVVKVFYVFTKKQGMGEGDFKLLAALGAWLGPMMLPFIILLSSLLGAIIGIVLLRLRGESRPFAFGPFIAIAGIVALLYNHPILQWYLGQY